MGELRRLKTKIKPAYKSSDEGVSELEDGDIGQGLMLVRNYIDNLDMDFYAGRAISSKQHSEPVTVKLPSDLIKDIAIIIESRRTQYRDRSELIRSAIYILQNYLANKLKGGFKERATLRDMIDYDRVEKRERDHLEEICQEFRKGFKEVAQNGDYELDKFIKKRVDMAIKQPKGFNRNKMLKTFWDVIKENEVNPEQYINKKEIEGV